MCTALLDMFTIPVMVAIAVGKNRKETAQNGSKRVQISGSGDLFDDESFLAGLGRKPIKMALDCKKKKSSTK